jgi:nitrogenase subunit NifH
VQWRWRNLKIGGALTSRMRRGGIGKSTTSSMSQPSPCWASVIQIGCDPKRLGATLALHGADGRRPRA